MKITKKQALVIARTAGKITMTNKELTYEQLLEQLDRHGRRVRAWQQDQAITLDFSGIHVDIADPLQKVYPALEVDDDDNSIDMTVILDADILLQYCVAHDANNTQLLDSIWAVAYADDSFRESIVGLNERFDPEEDYTPQLLRYRQQLREGGHATRH